MADQDLSHTAEIIKAAIPYVDSSLTGMAELFAKLLDLMGSLKSTGKSSGKLSANGLRGIKIDVEGLLKGIRPILSIKEREFVDKILGFLNMRKMLEMYNNMMSTMQTMQEFGGFNFGDFGSSNDAENVTGNFSSSNFDSIFKAFSSGFGSSDTSTPSEPVYATDTSESEAPFSTKDSFSTKETAEPEAPKEASSSTGNNSGMMNSGMMDMLKAMVPPEQMSTFENLSMLFNTMSYDNNKSDDNKELNDG